MRTALKQTFWDYAYIVMGTLLTAFGISVFMNPAQLAPGGVSGIATILYHLIRNQTNRSISLGLIMLVLSLPIYALGLKLFGKEYGFKTLLGTLLLSLFTMLFDALLPNGILDYQKESSVWLCTLFTGITSGVGIGLVLRSGSNTGGTDILAQVLARYTPLDLGSALLAVDGTIIFASLFLFGIEHGLYAIIVSMMTSLIIDRVIVPLGTNYAKTVYIISPKTKEIGTFILEDMNRSGTLMDAKGLFSQDHKDMLMTVVPKKDLSRLVRHIKDMDPTAFIIIQDTYHVLGEGYSSLDTLASHKDVTQA